MAYSAQAISAYGEAGVRLNVTLETGLTDLKLTTSRSQIGSWSPRLV